jgi:serine/threonine protein kinase
MAYITPTSFHNALRSPGQLNGRRCGVYQIEEEISRGGMGIVFRARDTRDDKIVSLKLMLVANHEKHQLGRFKREVAALALLDHPNIVALRDYNCDQAVPYFVMDYIEGQNLKDLVEESLRSKGAVPDVAWTLEVIESIAEALVHCERKGIIHRDIKPDNIIIRQSNSEPVLIDFGLVKRGPTALSESLQSETLQLSQTGEILGTPFFMSPEQVDSTEEFGPVGPATDIWGLGATLYYCLTGKPPFNNPNYQGLISELLQTEPTPIQELSPETPKWVSDFCISCLRKKSSRRPSLEVILDTVRAPQENRTLPNLIKWLSLSLAIFLLGGVGCWQYLAYDETQRWKKSLKNKEVRLKRLSADSTVEKLQKILRKLETSPKNPSQSKDPKFLEIKALLQVKLGRAKLRLNQFEMAEKDYIKAAKHLPNSDFSLQTLKLGLNLAFNPKNSSYITPLFKLLGRRPQDAELHAWAAYYLLEQGQLEKSDVYGQKALELGWRDKNLDIIHFLTLKEYGKAYSLLEEKPKLPLIYQRQIVKKTLERRFMAGKNCQALVSKFRVLNPSKKKQQEMARRFSAIVERDFERILQELLADSAKAIATMKRSLISPINRLITVQEFDKSRSKMPLEKPGLVVKQIAVSCWFEPSRSPSGFQAIKKITAALPAVPEFEVFKLQCASSILPPLSKTEMTTVLDRFKQLKLNNRQRLRRAVYHAFWCSNRKRPEQSLEILEAELPQSLKDVDDAISLVFFWGFLGRTRTKLKRYKDAIQAYTEALKIEQQPELLEDMIFAHSQLPDIDEALKLTQKMLQDRGISTAPTDARCFAEIARFIAQRARHKDAGETIRKACLKIRPVSPQECLDLALALSILGHFQSIKPLLSQSLSILKEQSPNASSSIKRFNELLEGVSENKALRAELYEKLRETLPNKSQ